MVESKIAFQRRLGDELCFAFRHFPVTPVHPLAEAAEAANAQGKFWEMHTILLVYILCWRGIARNVGVVTKIREKLEGM